MFIKNGDELEVQGYIDVDGQEQMCPQCLQPFVSVAFDEEDGAGLVCQCETLDVSRIIGDDLYE